MSNNDDDLDVSEEAEQVLQDWIMEPFLDLFEKMEPASSEYRVTLQDYLTPETYRYQMYGEDGKLQPFLDYAVLSKPVSDGIAIVENILSPKWLSFQPKDIPIERSSIDESLSRFPRKVSAVGTMYHFKPVYTGNRSATLREISIYNRLDEVFSPSEINVPFLHGVVRDEHSSVIIGLLLSWIECGTENLDCILSSETPLLSLREKWKTQITSTIQQLHDAGIV
ncbi:hypothetical protein N7492_004569 [Penicillium capsulatum]|uniref:Protein kinase domain-containing protein n=1 Tax=Penicillium capsulatum TaxID=69766 RepID=A0A9W9IAI1_9EURO|nr:hypothetical protein N7492_004569 [Penicillium capsulatum]KAJ6136313.1 hypothetical protein N7512_001473 [Penicillium capsulatum]